MSKSTIALWDSRREFSGMGDFGEIRNVLYYIINNSTLERLRRLDMHGLGRGCVDMKE